MISTKVLPNLELQFIAAYYNANTCINLCQTLSVMFFIGDMGSLAASGKHVGTHNSQPAKAAKVATDSAGEAGSSTRKRARSYMSLNQRRERHNSKERERR